MTYRYILEGRTPVPCDDVVKWALWFENADRRVGLDTIGSVDVSTYFIGTADFCLFETMVFGGGRLDGSIWRYPEWDVAEAGHKVIVALVQDYAHRLERYDALRMHDRYLRFPKPKRAPFWCPSTAFKEPRRKWKKRKSTSQSGS